YDSDRFRREPVILPDTVLARRGACQVLVAKPAQRCHWSARRRAGQSRQRAHLREQASRRRRVERLAREVQTERISGCSQRHTFLRELKLGLIGCIGILGFRADAESTLEDLEQDRNRSVRSIEWAAN